MPRAICCIVLGMILLLFSTTAVHARQPGKVYYTEVDVGPALSWFRYTEDDLAQYGFMEGVQLKAKFAQPAKYVWCAYPFLMLESELLGGLLTFDGERLDSSALYASSYDVMGEVRGLVGVDFLVGSARLMPYFGYGLRTWYDRVQDPDGYARWASYLSVPMGMEVGFDVGRKDEFGFRSEIAPVLYGWVSTYLSRADSGLDDARNTTNGGLALSNSLFFKTKSTSGKLLIWELFCRYQANPESEATTVSGDNPRTTAVESEFDYKVPSNETVMYGLRFSIGF
jgi:hypothetical protein